VASVLDQRLEDQRSDDHEREWTVIGVWGDGQHDEGRFAESFTARTPEEAEGQARQWARAQGHDKADITIAGVLRGGVEVVS